MSTLSEISELWEAFRKLPFPEAFVEDATAGDLVTIDSFVAGCIDTFLHDNGTLDPVRIDVLIKCEEQLMAALPQLSEEGKDYFHQLLCLAQQTLRYLKS